MINRNFVDRCMHYLDWVVDGVIILNALIILIATRGDIRTCYGEEIELFFTISTWIFISEITLRILWKGRSFGRNGWDVFDFVVVALSSFTLMHAIMTLRFFRLFRMFRLFRLFSINTSLRNLVGSLVLALPRVMWTSVLFGILFCIYATIGIESFGKSLPEYFGSIESAVFTLFQTMTLDSWASGIARTVMKSHPYAWIYFISFILIATYILLNLLLGVITATTIEVYERENSAQADRDQVHRALQDELKQLREQVSHVQHLLEQQAGRRKD